MPMDVSDATTTAAQCLADPVQSQEMETALNAARQVEGKTILRTHAKLAGIAQSHACDMARMGQATVAGSDGSNIVERARAVSYPTCGVVQLVTTGGTPTEVVNRWLASQPHREQVLGQLSTDIGAGVTIGPDGRRWWSVVMGYDCR
ncbi:MAG: CAP domain-containing protein [Paracoccus sp. (in: a-proteobacteria)]|uniref:CAP domain-containing protein n=1 Tax=Paracoccus sp. TaxID=267 RepID=UPI0026DF2A1B|nr:CAP domain-containing protein [Paracoccus sp. (in: a-proteobacteria)]MDO5631510.1 CAP domain-containing protein [Paracoccus sp. (in: a-proteobacteria)]